MNSFLIVANHATEAVAASTAVDIRTPSLAVDGIDWPATGFSLPAVLALQLTPGATPGNYTFELEQSETSGGTYTDVQQLTQATAISGLSFYNVTIDASKPFLRINVADATANAGTVTAYLLV